MSSLDTISVLTFNVWFSRREYAARAALLFDQIARADADVVALQEVTPRFLELLSVSPLLCHPGPVGAQLVPGQPRYHLCHTELSPLRPNGCAILTRWAPERIVDRPYAPPDDDMDRA